MTKFEEIRARYDAFQDAQPGDYECGYYSSSTGCCDDETDPEKWCKGKRKNDPFWDNAADDISWLIEEAELLKAELDKYHPCSEQHSCPHAAHGEFVEFTLDVPVYHRLGDMATTKMAD